MTFLLDTHLLLWLAAGDRRLSSEIIALINDQQHEFVFSVASLWEMAIKRSLGRSDFEGDPSLVRRASRDNGFEELPIYGEHVLAVQSLPWIHKDPFDRILIAQAAVEGLILLTSDRTVPQYPGAIRQV